MKIQRLEAHDRLKHLKKDQSLNLAQGCEDCLKKNELSLALQDLSPYIYIFAHPRTADDGVNKRMLWQPRLSKPKAQTNSYLFRAQSKTDIIEICWMIPPRELWGQYKKGNITEQDVVIWSIDQFENNRKNLEKAAPDDLSEEKGQLIYAQVISQHKQQIMINKLWNQPHNLILDCKLNENENETV
jgi:hypothetical protein